jgi:hypothetical protein
MNWGNWDYRIRGYAPPNQGGHLLLETVHRGEASRDMEISAWKARMARGEVSHIEVVDISAGQTHTIYSTDPPAPGEREGR